MIAAGAGAAYAQADNTDLRPRGVSAVYALTNDGFNNEVILYHRSEDGTLSRKRRFATGGSGSGVFESSTGMLILGSAFGQSSPVNLGGGSDLLFAANAGSDSISVFRVRDNGGLNLIEVQPSGGERPISLTVRNGLLYFLNSGGTLTGAGLVEGTITAFRVEPDGSLTRIDKVRKLHQLA